MIRLLKVRPYTGDIVAPSPNHGPRRAPKIEGIVLHATADEGDESLSLSWMRSPKSQASCHLLVSRAGWVTRLVGDQQRAWHAGLAWWRGTSDVNSITLGIEIANRNDGEPFTNAQYRRVAEIVAHYCRQGLSLEDVVSHAQIAEGRKTDPLGWDWARFRALVRRQMWPSDIPLPSIPQLPAVEPSSTVLPEAPVVPVVAGRIGPPAIPEVSASRKSKPYFRSRTLWLNGVTVLASGALLIGDAIDLAHRLDIILPVEITKWALFIVGLINIILRLKTNEPVSCSLDPNAPGCRPESMPDTKKQRPPIGEVSSRARPGRAAAAWG